MTGAIAKSVWDLKPRVVEVLRTIHDPEIPVNIYDLGLIYAIEVYDPGRVRILMTLTTPNCPVAGSFPAQVAAAVRALPEVSDCEVEIVWEPPWSIERMSTENRLQAGLL